MGLFKRKQRASVSELAEAILASNIKMVDEGVSRLLNFDDLPFVGINKNVLRLELSILSIWTIKLLAFPHDVSRCVEKMFVDGLASDKEGKASLTAIIEERSKAYYDAWEQAGTSEGLMRFSALILESIFGGSQSPDARAAMLITGFFAELKRANTEALEKISADMEIVRAS